MKKPIFALALSTLASVGIFAPSANAAPNVNNIPIYFASGTGGFSSPFTTPPGSNTIFGSFSGPGTGTTASFNPGAFGINPADVTSVVFKGTYSYNASSSDGLLFADLLSNGNSVQSVELAKGVANINNSPFFLDFTSATLANFNSDLAIRFTLQGSNVTASHTLTTVPEPSAMFALGVFGASAAAATTRKKLKAKTLVTA